MACAMLLVLVDVLVYPARTAPHKGDKREGFMAYVIAEPCIGVKDAACVDACPVDCIHPKKDSEKFANEELIYIDPVECIDCGACVPVCPVSAIFALDDLPEKWKQYTELNESYGKAASPHLRSSPNTKVRSRSLAFSSV